MIILYQLHWSHYVEKVRWALDFKGVEWSAVEVDPFSKRQMQHLECRTKLDSGHRLYTVPAIHDDATGTSQGDSSAIIDYLERTYPTPALYPAVPGERNEVRQWMVWLDSTLGLAARRLAYTQMALEHPGYLAELFLPHTMRNGEAARLKARLAGSIIAGVLTRRFRFLHNRADRVFEQLEQCLLAAAGRLSSRNYLVGDRFSAADLTLAALMRPALLVPFFRDHPRLQPLFNWRKAQLQTHARQLQLGYEAALQEIRTRRGWELGAVRWLRRSESGDPDVFTNRPPLEVARNDQHSVGRYPLITGAFDYLKLRLTCGLDRTSYPNPPS